jgi:hypothetical protein
MLREIDLGSLGACLVGAQACPAKILATYKILALVWLMAKILVANEKLPTYLMFPSQFLPKFWPTLGQGILSQLFG